MEEASFRAAGLAIENYWTALSFAAREIYLHHRYPSTDLELGFGFEDWAWNMETIDAGVLHKIVPGTGHVICFASKSQIPIFRKRLGLLKSGFL